MRWIWIVTVGVTDVQLPIWLPDAQAQQFTLHKYVVPGRDSRVRELHEFLLAMLRADCLEFPLDIPVDASQRQEGQRLEFMDVDGHHALWYASAGVPARLTPDRVDLVASPGNRLALYCPKVSPVASREGLLPVNRAAQRTVVVLQTSRDPRFNANEPIASGPIVSRFLAERLALRWLDSGGVVRSDQSLAGVSTWVDLLAGQERLEDDAARGAVRLRLHEALDAWKPDEGKPRRVFVTASGGIPGLKDFVEHTVAARYGDSAVELLTVPERGEPRVSSLRLTQKWSEQESLRFHCAEAMRAGALVDALGLAARFGHVDAHADWASDLVRALGPLVSLTGTPNVAIGGSQLQPWELLACRAEIALCRNDMASAIVALHAFLESAIWALIERCGALKARGYTVNVADETFEGPPPKGALAQILKPVGAAGKRWRHQYVFGWPAWIARATRGDTPYPRAARALAQLAHAYARGGRADSLRGMRNELSHRGTTGVDEERANRVLCDFLGRGELAPAYGANLLANDDVKAALALTGDVAASRLGQRLADELDRLARAVWRN